MSPCAYYWSTPAGSLVPASLAPAVTQVGEELSCERLQLVSGERRAWLLVRPCCVERRPEGGARFEWLDGPWEGESALELEDVLLPALNIRRTEHRPPTLEERLSMRWPDDDAHYVRARDGSKVPRELATLAELERTDFGFWVHAQGTMLLLFARPSCLEQRPGKPRFELFQGNVAGGIWRAEGGYWSGDDADALVQRVRCLVGT